MNDPTFWLSTPIPTLAAESNLSPLVVGVVVFVLAVFVGFELIAKVPSRLHTPLMSGSNAISGITIVGALLCSYAGSALGIVLGALAIVFATVNVVGGYLVTNRMLKMFDGKEGKG